MARHSGFSALCIALAVFALAALSIGDPSSGDASNGGLKNPGFESGLTNWTAQAADLAAVVGTETSAQCPTYTNMGGITVAPYKGAKQLKLGQCRAGSNSQQPKGVNKASQTFVASDSPLRFALNLNSWEHRGYDSLAIELKKGSQNVGTIVGSIDVPMAGVPGGKRTCSGAMPCSFTIDAGKSGQFVATGWVTGAIDISAYIGQSLTLTYSLTSTKDSGFATWAYFDNFNTEPVARFTFDASLSEGQFVRFNDTSFDPDFELITDWLWEITPACGAPPCPSAQLSQQNPVFIFPDNGIHSACLTVSDGTDTNRVCSGAVASDGTRISTLSLNNVAPGVNALNVETVTGLPAQLFGRILDAGWLDTVSAGWNVGTETPAATVQQDNLGFLSTGFVTGLAFPGASGTGTLTVNDGDGGVASDPFTVSVIANNPNRDELFNNSLATAPSLTSDASYMFWIGAAGDVDFYKVQLPDGPDLPPGSEILVSLKGPGGTGLNADYDLVLLSQVPGAGGLESGDAGQTSTDTAGYNHGGYNHGGYNHGGYNHGGYNHGGYNHGSIRPSGYNHGGYNHGGYNHGSAQYPLSQTGFNGLTGESVGTADITLDELGLGALAASGVSVAGYSANRGLGNEAALAVVDEPGTVLYVAVLGYNGAFSTAPGSLQIESAVPADPVAALGTEVCTKTPLVTPPTATVEDLNPGFPPSPSATETLIVTQRQRLIALGDEPSTPENEGLTAWNLLLPKLQALAQHSSVNADIISVASDDFDGWDINPCDVDEANATTAAIKSEIQARLLANPSIHYVVLAGDDDVIPQRRVPDETMIGNEANYVLDALVKPGSPLYSSLLEGFILTDDYYVDTVPTPWQGRELYVPDIPIGRLTETQAEIGAAADAFLQSGGQLDYSTGANATALVTGYDFFADGANVTAANLASKLSTTTVINDTWTSNDLRCRLLGQAVPGLSGCSTPGVGAVNAHYTHYVTVSANGWNQNQDDLLRSTEVAVAGGSLPALKRKVLFTMGCHGGLSVPDRAALPADPGLGIDPALDFVQAMARQQAVWIASTGYGLGDDQGLGGTELLLTIFSDGLTDGNAPIGDTFRAAKESYLLGLTSMTTYDEKSSIQLTMFGLPQYEVLMPPAPSAASTLQAPPGDVSFDLTVEDSGSSTTTRYALDENQITGKGSYFSARPASSDPPGDAQATAFRPVQPRIVIPIPPGNAVQGVVIKSGTFSDTSGFDPVISLPIEEWQIEELEPDTCLDAFWPAAPATVNSIDPGGGGPQALVITPGQFRCTSGDAATVTGVERVFTSLTVELLHSDPSDQEPPLISSVDLSSVDATTVAVTVNTSDPSGIQKVLVVKQSGGAQQVFELTLDALSGSFTGNVTGYADGDSLFVQSIDGADNVSIATAKGTSGYTNLFVDLNPDPNYVLPGSLATFQLSIPSFGDLLEPFYMIEFGDGQFGSGPVSGSTMSITHTYPVGTVLPTTARIRVMDANGLLGSDSVRVRELCDPIGDSSQPNIDLVGCEVTIAGGMMTIALRVDGVIQTSAQYRVNIQTATTNAQLKFDNGHATGPLSSLQVTVGDPDEVRFTFSLAEVGLTSPGQTLQWSSDAQTVGFPDRMPNSGVFTFVLP